MHGPRLNFCLKACGCVNRPESATFALHLWGPSTGAGGVFPNVFGQQGDAVTHDAIVSSLAVAICHGGAEEEAAESVPVGARPGPLHPVSAARLHLCIKGVSAVIR